MRVRLGELSSSERKRLTALDTASVAFFREGLLRPRASSWWGSAVRALWPGLDAEPWHDGRLVVCAERRELLPIAERVTRAAPASLAVMNHRPALPAAAALSRVRERFAIDFSRARFRAGFGRGHLLDIVLYLPGGRADEREQTAAEQLVCAILGERQVDDWVGAVSVAALPREGPLRVIGTDPRAREGRPLAELEITARAAIEGLRAALPGEARFHSVRGREWTLFELEPEPAEDWSGQDDLIMTTTSEPELLKCFLSGASFSSVRFSRHKEVFFHLKYEARGTPEARLQRRVELEDVLDTTLTRARAGCVFGGGLGLRYAYIDLALCDAADEGEALRGLELVRGAALAAGLPPRSWLLPFDDDWRAEWLEIHPDAPPPPGLPD